MRKLRHREEMVSLKFIQPVNHRNKTGNKASHLLIQYASHPKTWSSKQMVPKWSSEEGKLPRDPCLFVPLDNKFIWNCLFCNSFLLHQNRLTLKKYLSVLTLHFMKSRNKQKITHTPMKCCVVSLRSPRKPRIMCQRWPVARHTLRKCLDLEGHHLKNNHPDAFFIYGTYKDSFIEQFNIFFNSQM